MNISHYIVNFSDDTSKVYSVKEGEQIFKQFKEALSKGQFSIPLIIEDTREVKKIISLTAVKEEKKDNIYRNYKEACNDEGIMKAVQLYLLIKHYLSFDYHKMQREQVKFMKGFTKAYDNSYYPQWLFKIFRFKMRWTVEEVKLYADYFVNINYYTRLTLSEHKKLSKSWHEQMREWLYETNIISKLSQNDIKKLLDVYVFEDWYRRKFTDLPNHWHFSKYVNTSTYQEGTQQHENYMLKNYGKNWEKALKHNVNLSKKAEQIFSNF